MAKYTPDAGCFNEANKAAKGLLSKEEIEAAFQRIEDQRLKMKAEGKIGGLGRNLRKYAQEQGERTRVVAAMRRRHAALNILVRDKLEAQIDAYMDAGLSPRESMLAVFEGTTYGVKDARSSVDALREWYRSKYLGRLLNDLDKELPQMRRMLSDKKFDDDLKREMWEIREGGEPGKSGNPDAQKAAKIFHKHLEIARSDGNRLGASIGKLDGYSGPQVHDPIKLVADKEGWVNDMLARVDRERTFEDITDEDKIIYELEQVYKTITTGVSDRVTALEEGKRVAPSNMAARLGSHRVLHFKSAEDAIAYNDRWGHGSTITGMFHHLERMSRFVANMETLGPNPEVMVGSIVANLARKVRNSTTIPDPDKPKLVDQLKLDSGKIRQAMDISSGLASRPDVVKWARISEDIRGVTRMAKLGSAIFSAFGGDQVTMAMASMFRGSGFFRGLFKSFESFALSRPGQEGRELRFLLGEGLDSFLGQISNAAAAYDGPMGFMGSVQEKFFRWNGLTGWTDRMRATSARMISSELGMHSEKAWAELNPRYRNTLEMNGFTEGHWNVIRSLDSRQINGNKYITADLAALASDESIEPLVRAQIAAARKASKVDAAKTEPTRLKREADFERRKAKILEEGRRDVETTIGRYINDEAAFSVIEMDARARRTTTFGYRPGTAAGEAFRFLMTFKGFPIAFMQRTWGRAWRGHAGKAGWFQHSGDVYAAKSAHIGAMLFGMTMAGYWSLMLKDMSKGYWPPRDPLDPKVWAAAFVQGGAMGIYGDFLFSKVNRFGSSFMETAPGPVIGDIAKLIDIGMELRDYALDSAIGEDEPKFPLADLFNFAVGNTPFANLYYVKPAVDALVLDSVREYVSPGSIDRQLSKREEAHGQTNWIKELSR